MACRIQNLTQHRLALDLRDRVLHLEPNQISPPLAEEVLYDNVHLGELLRSGAVRLLEARMSEVLGAASGPPGPGPEVAAPEDEEPAPKVPKPAKSAGRKRS